MDDPPSRNVSVCFRVDSSIVIGTGHVMRCLTFANQLKEKGAQTHFICRDFQGNLSDLIRQQGYKLTLLPVAKSERQIDKNHVMPTRYESWLGADWNEDAKDAIESLIKEKSTWLIVDHYAIDAKWERKVKDATSVKIMDIDGQANRAHDCDILLDQTYSAEGASRWKHLLPQSCRLFVGPQYALIRPEFVIARKKIHKRDGIVKRILITFGGIDQPNMTSQAIDAVLASNLLGIEIDVLISAANPHREILAKLCKKNANLTLHVQSSNIAELMSKADLAIGGGGTMMLERCMLGLPTLVIAIAENQIEPARQLAKLGAAIYLGNADEMNIKTILTDKVNELINNKNNLRKIENNCFQLMRKSHSEYVDIIVST